MLLAEAGVARPPGPNVNTPYPGPGSPRRNGPCYNTLRRRPPRFHARREYPSQRSDEDDKTVLRAVRRPD